MRRLLLATLTLLLISSGVSASSTQMRLQILPIECLFEVVDDGTGKIVYLNPEKCPGYTEPPDGPEELPDEVDIDEEEDFRVEYYFPPIASTDREEASEGEEEDSEAEHEDIIEEEPDDPVPPPLPSPTEDTVSPVPVIILSFLLLLFILSGLLFPLYAKHKKEENEK